MPNRIRVIFKKPGENIVEFLAKREKTGSKAGYPGAKVKIDIPANLTMEELEAAIKGNVFGLYSECVVIYRPLAEEGLRNISSAAIQALPYIRSESLDIILAGPVIRNEKLSVLAATLDKCPNLKTLDLACNGIGDAEVRVSTATLDKCPNLQTLDLSFNRIGDKGAIFLATKLSEFQNLRTLNLSENIIKAEGVCALAAALPKCPHLQTLNLSSNDIGAAGAEALAAVLLECPHLQTLDIQNIYIGSKGIDALATALYITNELRNGTDVKPLNILGTISPLGLKEKIAADSEVLRIKTERLQTPLPSTAPINPITFSIIPATSTLSQ